MLLTKIRGFIFRTVQSLLYKIVKINLIGSNVETLGLDPSKPIVFATFYPSLAERLVIDKEAMLLGWPRTEMEGFPSQSFFSIYRRSRAPFKHKPMPIVPNALVKQGQWLLEHPEQEIQIVPVRVFWGKAPEKEHSFLRIWLQLSGTFGGRLSTFFAVLLNGRHTFVHFSRPLSLRELMQQEANPEKVARKVARILRVHNRQVSASVLGPDLSHRRTLVHQILNKPLVVKAIAEEAENKNISKQKARQRAFKYADEIASNISYSNVRFLDVLLTWVWNKIYSGVQLHNVQRLRDVSQDNEIIYVPCHRSHIDYLLLSYVLYHNGLQLPHIAAGINLNMPIVGSILRRGGAFFMRRTFRDNPLYAMVFDEYLHSVFSGGFAVEYFVEGGRSRTGRTLNPKAGMLAMTVRSYLRDSTKPIIFMPVYTGYEKVFEANSYLGELRGNAKKKENLFSVFGSLRSFKNSFGTVQVTFGEPIHLTDFLNQKQPEWQQTDYSECDYRPQWAAPVVNDLALEVVTNINKAASVNPVNLMALSLLTSARQAMAEPQLVTMLESYHALLAAHPYSDDTQLPEGTGQEWIDYVERLGSVNRSKHSLGDIIQTDERQAVILTYYRNNILHLLALPSVLACIFLNNQTYSQASVQETMRELYPYLQAELFLRWNLTELEQRVEQWLAIFIEQGYLVHDGLDYRAVAVTDDKRVFLESLAANMMQTLQRYYLTLRVLQTEGGCGHDAQALEEQCTLIAQRISVLYGINAPEFFDKNLFRTLIQKLMDQGLVHNSENQLCYNDALPVLSQRLEQLLDSSIRQSILRSLD